MLKKSRHKIKLTLLKAMAVVITMCYVIEPVQDQLKYILHYISHNLEAPSYILQHDNNITNKENYNFQSSITNHEHKILDFIDKLISSTKDKDKHQGQSVKEYFSSKKIIEHYKYAALIDATIPNAKKDNFKTLILDKRKGYSLQLYRPPQLLSHI